MRPKLIAVELAPVDNIAESSQHLEAAGYDGYWLTEHYGAGRSASPLVGAAIAASATSPRFRVGTAAVLVRHRQPLQIAAAARLLASQFPGRIDIGLASATVAGSNDDNPLLTIDARSFQEMVAATQSALAYDIAGPTPSTSPQLFICGSSQQSARVAARLRLPYAHGPMSDDDSGALDEHRRLAEDQERSLLVRVICRATAEAAADEAAIISASTPVDLVGDAAECADIIRQLAVAHGATTIAVAQLGTDTEKIRTGHSLLARACTRELVPQP